MILYSVVECDWPSCTTRTTLSRGKPISDQLWEGRMHDATGRATRHLCQRHKFKTTEELEKALYPEDPTDD